MNPNLQLAVIVNAHLFGTAGIKATGDAPQTTMPLILAGVIADKDPNKGQAIIGENAMSAKLVAVGGNISGGARLHAVYSDRVLLERNGALETLSLPHNPQPGGGSPAPPSFGSRIAQAASSNPTLLAGMVRIQPVFTQGKLSGYRIFPGGTKGNAAFSQLGLKPGDLIEAVNGTSLDDAARAMEVLQTLSSSASATVTVSRNGQSQEVNLNLASLNVDPEVGGENAPNAPPAAGAGPTSPEQTTPIAPPPSVPGIVRPRRGDAANMGILPGTSPNPNGNMDANAGSANSSNEDSVPPPRER
jgi:general secretion pathway protein C